MSYILDALKKLEKERRRGNVPDILTTQEFPEKGKKKRIIWPYLTVIALLLNAGLLIWWMSWEIGKSNSISKAGAGKSFNSETAVTVETDFTKTDKKVDNSQNRLLSDKNNLKNKVSKNTPLASDRSSAKEIYLASKDVQKRETENIITPSSDDIIEPPLKNRIYNLEELPLQIKQKLPPLKITVSLYSDDPASRMAKINDQRLSEGEYLTAGLKLEEITPDSVIFNYQNYRFRVGLR
jgi:hypothetical protein